MLYGYHRLFNRVAGKVTIKPYENPDIELAVGYMEEMRPQLINIEMLPPNTKPVFRQQITLEDSSPKQASMVVTASMFPSSGWLGTEYGGY